MDDNGRLWKTLEDDDAVFAVVDEKVRSAAPAELVLVVVEQVLEVLVSEPVGAGGEGRGARVMEGDEFRAEVGERNCLEIRLKLGWAEAAAYEWNWHRYLRDEELGGLSTARRAF